MRTANTVSDPVPTTNDRGPAALRILVASAFGIHLADQVGLVTGPLFAAIVFDASPTAIAVIVAGQAAGHLVGSLPAGLIVDRRSPRHLITVSALVSILGFGTASLGVATDSLATFGLAISLAGFGVVLFTLGALSMIPLIAGPVAVARANSLVDIPRSLASFAVPLTIGLAATTANAGWMLVATAAGAAAALAISLRLPDFPAPRASRQRPIARIAEAGRFVAAQPMLKAIALCSGSWNFAFAVLLVAVVPLLNQFGRDPGVFGTSLACFGIAMVCGTWLVGHVAGRIAPRTILMFGPASSVIAGVMILVATPSSPNAWYWTAFFVMGFGPSMWLVTQNTVRQLVTPRELLGRVNAVIQTASYGARPIGAAAAGIVIELTSPRHALALAVLLYSAATVAAASSRLRRVTSYTELQRASWTEVHDRGQDETDR